MAAKRGRPSSFQDMAPQVCRLIAEGLSLRQIGATEGMPSMTTIMRWAFEKPEFREQYARAREMQAERFADEILEISDDGTNDWMTREQGDDTVTVIDHEHISRSKLRVDSRKWLMSKLAPKKYGDKLEHSGPNGAPLTITLVSYKDAK